MERGGGTVTFTFDQCVLPISGKTIDGTIVVSHDAEGGTLAISFGALSVGPRMYDGTVSASSLADGVRKTWNIATDLSYANGRTGRSLTLDGVTLTADETSIVLNGFGSAAGPEHAASVAADAVTRNRGECHPSSGTLSATADERTAAITFLETTPDDGIVMVSVDGAAAEAVELLRPCALAHAAAEAAESHGASIE
jgi:hypothetical protein